MRSRRTVAVLAVAIALGGIGSAARQATFRATTDGVVVDVSVRNGLVPVAGLVASDFALEDNGVPQEIQSVSIEAVPMDVSLVVDLSGSVVGDVGGFKTDVRKFVTQLRPIDRVQLIAFAMGVREVVPWQAPTGPLALDGLETGGSTSLNDALLYALLRPADPARRHLIVALTDGRDNFSVLDSASLPAVAAHGDAVLHVVLVKNDCANPGCLTPRDLAGRRSLPALLDATQRTGGEVHAVGRAVDDFTRIAADFRASYVLHFVPRNVPRAGWHELTVKVVSPGAERYTVRARKGYAGG